MKDIKSLIFKGTPTQLEDLKNKIKDLPEEVLNLESIQKISTKLLEVSRLNRITLEIFLSTFSNDFSVYVGAPARYTVSPGKTEIMINYKDENYKLIIEYKK